MPIAQGLRYAGQLFPEKSRDRSSIEERSIKGQPALSPDCIARCAPVPALPSTISSKPRASLEAGALEFPLPKINPEPVRRLYRGDCLGVLRMLPSASVNLVIADPPYGIGAATAGGPFGDYDDRFKWGPAMAAAFARLTQAGGPLADALHYFAQKHGRGDGLAHMTFAAEAISAIHRVLTPDGSALWFASTSNAHDVAQLFDAAFCAREGSRSAPLIWQRTSAHNDAKRKAGGVYDVILLYRKGRRFTWHKQYALYSKNYLASKYRDDDGDGRGPYRWDNLTGPGVSNGESGKPWRGIDPAGIGRGRHWVPLKSVSSIPDYDKFTLHQRLDALDANGFIRWPRKPGGKPELKRHLGKGRPVQDVITHLPPVNSQAGERTGWPTQKPQALIEMLIAAASNPGDLILDPFAGCGTTLAAAEKLKRSWIGIEISPKGCTQVRRRLTKDFGLHAAAADHGTRKLWHFITNTKGLHT